MSNRRWNDTKLRLWLRDPENRVTVVFVVIAVTMAVVLYWKAN